MRHHARTSGAVILGAVCALMLMPGYTMAQQESDYAIVKSFRSKVSDIRTAIRQAQTVQECGQISADIDELVNDFAADTVLLNKALYPQKYDDQIGELRTQLLTAQNRLGIIDSQMTQIAGLETQVRSLSGTIDSLTAEDDKMMASLDVMSKALILNAGTIDSLRRIVMRLEQGLRARTSPSSHSPTACSCNTARTSSDSRKSRR